MKTLVRLAAFLLLLGLVGAAYVYSGAYDVSANHPEGWLDRLAQQVAHRSIHRRAEQVEPPAGLSLDDPALVRRGAVLYEDMCVTCHGAPGVEVSEVGTGLSPAPPDLVDEGGEEDPAELFWVTRNGVRMTGMPAFGVTHSDEEIWAMVAAIRRLHTLSPEQYQELVGAGGADAGGGPEGPAAPGAHTHGPGRHSHGPGEEHGEPGAPAGPG